MFLTILMAACESKVGLNMTHNKGAHSSPGIPGLMQVLYCERYRGPHP